MGGQHALLPGGTVQHSLLQQGFIHHVQLPRAAGFVQHQQIAGLCQRRRKVLVLQIAGSSLFGFVHLKNEFLPGLAPVNGSPQLLQQRNFSALAALQKLHDDHTLSAAQCPQGKPHSGRSLTLTIAIIEMQKSQTFHCVSPFRLALS